MQPLLVNIGCGRTWHPSWTNLDAHPLDSHVREWDVGKGLPFEREQVDACYASHILEHLTRDQARMLLQDSYRVLRSGGVIRLVVPDLEGIVREYLRVLELAESGDQAAVEHYQWITLELLDQLVRDRSGGEMERYLRTQARRNADYVIARIGPEAKAYMEPEYGRQVSQSSQHATGSCCRNADNLISKTVKKLWSGFSDLGQSLVRKWGSVLSSGEQEVVRVGRFRFSGECHQWMYDRFSLNQMLKECGFSEIRRCSAFESRIEGFTSFGLDVVDGTVRKPDSLFMEAIKP